MRIAMIALDQPGRLTDLVAELSTQGHDVIIHTRRQAPGKRRTTLAPGVILDHLPAGPERPLSEVELLSHLGELGQRLADRWRRRPPDIVHPHGWQSGLAALAGSTTIPMVQSHGLLACRCGPRGPTPTPGSVDLPIQARLERALSRTAVASIVTCEQARNDLNRLGVPRPRITVIPWGVDTGEYTRYGPAYPRTDGPRLVVLDGPGIGAETAIRALSRVPYVQLVIAGGAEAASLETDPATTRLRLLAKEEAVDDRVLLLGRVTDRQLPQLIRSADLVLALGPYDPYGTDILSAMACGVPAMATTMGAHLDIITDDVTGILISDTTPTTLSGRLRAFLADPTQRQALGLAAEDRVRSRHSWPRIATETHHLYQKTIDQDRRAAPAARPAVRAEQGARPAPTISSADARQPRPTPPTAAHMITAETKNTDGTAP